MIFKWSVTIYNITFYRRFLTLGSFSATSNYFIRHESLSALYGLAGCFD